MNEIQIQVTTPNGDPHDIAAPLDMRVDAFVRELMPALRLANTDAEGHPIVWHLYSKASGRELVPDQTLQQNGVQAGHRLNLVRRTVAG
ncbi:MAG TPA: EsaB/YukD family protein [Gemmata sp.]